MSHGPIQDEYREKMNRLARMLDKILNDDPTVRRSKRIGFALLMYPFGAKPDGARINYIGNGKRADVLIALKELVARWEGRVQEPEEEQ